MNLTDGRGKVISRPLYQPIGSIESTATCFSNFRFISSEKELKTRVHFCYCNRIYDARDYFSSKTGPHLMRIFYLVLFGIILASCSSTGGGTSPVPAGLPGGSTSSLKTFLGTEPSVGIDPSSRHGYDLLYSFGNSQSGDGSYPYAGLTSMAGDLYGTTTLGGGTPCISGLGCGTVFKVSASGAESILYKFQGSPDGSGPEAGVTVMSGVLYGTTSEGGAGAGCSSPSGNCGTVFQVTASGMETVLYTFKGGTDGYSPWGTLLAVNGKLYGTTAGGGAAGYGTVFSLTTSGKETVLHSFGNVPDAAYPYGGLIALHGALYGTTYAGGFGPGYGTVFKISTSGKEHVIYSFNPNTNNDGSAPQAGVVAVSGMLYGTTVYGGTNNYGTVFQVTTSGQETVLDRFATASEPTDALIAVKGKLYGTTQFGGRFICRPSQSLGCGTVFKISTSGKETVLHNFNVVPDGAQPAGSLLAVNGTLYGTTEVGGSSNAGTIFKVSP